MAGDRSASNHLQRSRGLSALTLGAIALVLSAGACSGATTQTETAAVTASPAADTSSNTASETSPNEAPTSSALADDGNGEQSPVGDEPAASAENSGAISTSVASSEPTTVEADSAPTTTNDAAPPTTQAAPLQVVESKEYGFAQVLPRGFEPVELDEEDADGAAVFINTETNTVIRVYGAAKAPARQATATTPPTTVATDSTATTAAAAAGSTTTVAAAGATTGSTTTIATGGQQTASTTSAPTATTGGATQTTTAAATTQSTLPLSTATTELVPMYNDDNANIAATDFATQQISAPIDGEGDNVIVTSTVDVGTHIVVIEVEGPPETVEETLEDASNGLVLRDPDPSEVRLSDSISLAIPGGFSATGSSNGWLQYASADQTMTIISGVSGGSGGASTSGTLAMIDQYGDETGATANYSIWSAVEADGRAVGEIVVSAPGSSFGISVDGSTTSGVNNRLSAVRNRLIVTDLAAS